MNRWLTGIRLSHGIRYNDLTQGAPLCRSGHLLQPKRTRQPGLSIHTVEMERPSTAYLRNMQLRFILYKMNLMDEGTECVPAETENKVSHHGGVKSAKKLRSGHHLPSLVSGRESQ